MSTDPDNGPPPDERERRVDPGERGGAAPSRSGDPIPHDERRETNLSDDDDAEVDADLADCLRFIESVRRESPHCLTGLGSDSGKTPLSHMGEETQHQEFWLSAAGDVPAKIGRFEILDKLGEGGFGLVFLAFDPDLDRQVALKVPRVETLVTNETRLRFLREGKAAARLDHRNIATVYEASQFGPICYIVSAHCRGGSLADLLSVAHLPEHREPQPTKSNRCLSFRAVATLIMELARAVQHAHERGILHRDLKPSNILFDCQLNGGRENRAESRKTDWQMPLETDLASTARIVDFGLAKSLHEDEERTRTGTTLGTASYMSPEQAHGHKSRIGPTTDIYSLGAILYELLVGKPPLRKASHVETIIAVKNEEPVAPRRIHRVCPRDLEAICLKCLEKDPARRYTSAALLADDLHRYLQGATVRARSPSFVNRTWRWCRRNSMAALLTAVILALAVVGPIAALNQHRLYREATVARDDARRALYTSDMNLALRDWDEANIERCGELLTRHLPLPDMRDYRGFEWFYLWRLWQQSEQTPVVLHDESLECIALSSDENLLAVGCGDGVLFLWDLIESRKIAEWQAHPYRTFSVRFSEDGRMLASANVDREVKLWDVATHRELAEFAGSRSVAFSPADGAVAYRTETSIALLDAGATNPRTINEAHGAGVGCVVFSPDGRSLASAGWDGTLKVWNVSEGNCVLETAGHGSAVWTMDWSPDGKYIATGDVNGTIRLWDAATGAEHRLMSGHTATIYTLVFDQDSSMLASAGVDNIVKIWQVSTGSQLKVLRGHLGAVTSAAFVEGGRRLLTASEDGDIKSWNIACEEEPSRDILEHPAAATSVAFSTDNQLIATGCSDGQIRLWKASGELLCHLDGHKGTCWRVRFLPARDHATLVSTGADGAVRIWDVASRQVRHEFAAAPDWTVHLPVAASQGGSRLAFADTDFTVQVWDLDQNSVVLRITTGRASDIKFSRDGQQLMVVAGESLSLWNIENGEQVFKASIGSRELTCLSVAPNGISVAAGSVDRTVKLWDIVARADGGGQSLGNHRALIGPAAAVWAIVHSPDGSMVASSGEDQVIRLWDSATGEQRAALSGHTASIGDLAFAPNGRVLASASDDHTVRLWRAPQR